MIVNQIQTKLVMQSRRLLDRIVGELQHCCRLLPAALQTNGFEWHFLQS